MTNLINKNDWQLKGGTLEIPDGWFVNTADFDADKPYIYIFPSSESKDYKEYSIHGKKLQVPKALAYYLSVHFCGSELLREIYINSGKQEIQNKIKEALGIIEP